jgi:hypothetical protein
MRRRRFVVVAVLFGLVIGVKAQQLLMSPTPKSGGTVNPVFEGWYPNADGTKSISFGYFNRNSEEALDVQIGADNSIAPGEVNQGQPTHFEPRRHWGVFAVKVPANFDKEVVWTLKVRGQTFAIPGYLHPNWQIDALEGEAGSGNTPPLLKFSATGPEGNGPYGITGSPLTATVGAPLAITVWAKDDGKTSGSVASAGRAAVPVSLTWFLHQGPGKVVFAPATARVPSTGGTADTSATFSVPGNYVLRVRANDASGVAGAGHAQCCWSNGFVKVTVK